MYYKITENAEFLTHLFVYSFISIFVLVVLVLSLINKKNK